MTKQIKRTNKEKTRNRSPGGILRDLLNLKNSLYEDMCLSGELTSNSVLAKAIAQALLAQKPKGEKLAEAYHYLPFEYSKVRNAYDLECKEALKALEGSSSPLEFFRELNFLYGWYVFQLGYATTKGGPFPEHTHLDQFIDVFGTEMLRGVR